jgi:fatty acid desaturase
VTHEGGAPREPEAPLEPGNGESATLARRLSPPRLTGRESRCDNRTMAPPARRHWRERLVGTPLHDLLGVWMLVWSLAPTVAVIAAFHRWPSVWSFLGAVVFSGVRMNALFVAAHEAYHYNLFRSRKLNVWVGGALASYSVMMPFFHNQKTHWDHHRYVGTARDPDSPAWDWPHHQRGLFVRELLLLATGLSYVDRIVRIVFGLPRAASATRKARPMLEGEMKRREIARLIVVQLGVLALFSVTIGPQWYVPLWLFPAMSVFPAWFTVREMLEHRRGAIIVYRAGMLERFLLGCFNFHLHAYHHAHASAAWFTLPIMKEKAHAKLDGIVYLDSYFAELVAYLRGRSEVPSRMLERTEALPAGDAPLDERDGANGEVER